jgi:hypothetical protein
MKKAFDCVANKARVQQELRDEYERRSGEFTSYVDFINATADEDPIVRAFRQRSAKASKDGPRAPTAAGG